MIHDKDRTTSVFDSVVSKDEKFGVQSLTSEDYKEFRSRSGAAPN